MPEEQSEPAEKSEPVKSLQLNTLNGVFVALAFLFYFARLIVGGEYSSEALGRLSGQMMASFLVPYVFGLLAFLVSFRSQAVGRTIFNVFVVTSTLGQFAKVAVEDRQVRQIQHAKAAAELDQNRESFVQNIRSAESIDEVNQANEQYRGESLELLRSMEASSSGVERQTVQVLIRIKAENDRLEDEWGAALSELESDRLLDAGVLTNDEEFELQKQIVRTFHERNQRYRKRYNELPEIARTEFSRVSKTHQMTKGALEGLIGAYHAQKGVFIPMLDAYDQYAQVILDMLVLLQKEQGRWSATEEGILFEDESALEEYDQHYLRLAEAEGSINDLREKYLDVLSKTPR